MPRPFFTLTTCAQAKALRLIGQTLMALALLTSTGPGRAAPPGVWGYVAWWMQDQWKSQPLAGFERLVFFQIEVSAEGDLDARHGWPEQWTELIRAAADNAVPLDLGLTLLDTAVFNAVFGSQLFTDRLLAAALALASQPGVSGLHLDIEVNGHGARPDTLRRFREFVATLGLRLRQQAPQRSLSVFLGHGDYAAIFDAPTLSRVDHAVLQGYDAHYLKSAQAGPVSPLAGGDYVTWVKMLAIADGLGLPRSRMRMGFPLYGYEWTVPSCLARGDTRGAGETTTLMPMAAGLLPQVQANVRDRVARHGARLETTSGSLYYRFVAPTGVCTVGWFEDSVSLGLKSDWIASQKIGGIAFFPLGYDQGELLRIQLARWPRGPQKVMR
jgi:spore germination protein